VVRREGDFFFFAFLSQLNLKSVFSQDLNLLNVINMK